ncbi:hypothetical protein JOQ06_004975 [Pogonophryne albipinna]|uniref:Uncharacterized protein n=1 Tax=Pogonophryne albipinna TaxID=1090488 RepID=A0AAD6FC64_9TELE|nr:hypothetical protein JOQ06_004975 [Pogonophryne albipinna]
MQPYCRAESVPGRPLTVRAGCPPNLLLQRDASWPAAASAATIVTSEAGEGEREKMGAASLHHAHPLTEMLNLTLASLPLVAGFQIIVKEFTRLMSMDLNEEPRQGCIEPKEEGLPWYMWENPSTIMKMCEPTDPEEDVIKGMVIGVLSVVEDV